LCFATFTCNTVPKRVIFPQAKKSTSDDKSKPKKSDVPDKSSVDNSSAASADIRRPSKKIFEAVAAYFPDMGTASELGPIL
jgi:hypothetical protein